ncbi:MAG: hypothetical protein K0R24_79 [Gammaproteobacteria bacterium]|nr:hypothetical protein [Gammaproteobacteria bacterium]
MEILDSEEEMKIKYIIQRIKEPPAERTLRDDLAILKKKGFIQSSGHARTTTWFIIKKT